MCIRDRREYGSAIISQSGPQHPLFEGLPSSFEVWASHGDNVLKLPDGFRILAESENAPIVAFTDDTNRFGIQFHPEVVHTSGGTQLLHNFLFEIVKCRGTWDPESFIDETIQQVRQLVGNAEVICGLSGGVDSAVAAALVHEAIGDQLTCIFVDNGLLRQNEAEQVVQTLSLIHI